MASKRAPRVGAQVLKVKASEQQTESRGLCSHGHGWISAAKIPKAIRFGGTRFLPVGERPRRSITKKALTEVVESRYEELFRLVQAELRRSGFEELVASGIVLTGGAANVVGCLDLAEMVFKMPVRLGVPYASGLPEIINNSMYATGVGLLLYGHQQQYDRKLPMFGNGVKGVFGRMRGWFQNNF